MSGLIRERLRARRGLDLLIISQTPSNIIVSWKFQAMKVIATTFSHKNNFILFYSFFFNLSSQKTRKGITGRNSCCSPMPTVAEPYTLELELQDKRQWNPCEKNSSATAAKLS